MKRKNSGSTTRTNSGSMKATDSGSMEPTNSGSMTGTNSDSMTRANSRSTKRVQSISEGTGSNSEQTLLVVAVGASAGGVEALTELVHELPSDTGMAFVLVQHLDPKHHSILTDLLARQTRMSVAEVTDGMRLEPNRVYVIPPNATMTLTDHTLKLTPRGNQPGSRMPIDHFMRSLAEEQGTRSVGVILSGFGSDGTLGLGEIQAQGGVTFAQDEASAKYDGMPRSAITAGYVDYVMAPKAIAQELVRIARHPYVGRTSLPGAEIAGDGGGLNAIFQLLRRNTGLDFTHYRQTTIVRRIQRRMIVHKIEHLQEYVRYVQTNPSEIQALYQDMLINVTSFFRNPDVFEAMKTDVFPRVIANRGPHGALRVWTPGCASGEETYSVAIALLEYLGENASQTSIQFFGTDVSETSISKARAGLYPENIQADVSPERLRRFFTKWENGYRINKSVRDMCIFAQHNLLSDPPFSQMDIICCRNLLIYLEPVLQSRVISLFHYSARTNGYLILGSSEGSGAVNNLFSTVERMHKIFVKKAAASRQVVTFSLTPQTARAESDTFRSAKTADTAWNYLEAQKEFDRRLLAQHSPAAAFINDDLEIIHTRGNISLYLKLSSGRASLSILKMAREGLLYDLRNAIARAKKENRTIRKQNVQLRTGDGSGSRDGSRDSSHDSTRTVTIEVSPVKIGNVTEKYFMVLFTDAPPEAETKAIARRSGKTARDQQKDALRVTQLEEEIAATKEHLQSVVETQEATNEELQSANEEILSSNEELQSTNEELETAKEELQSTNEELSTVNDELRGRNMEIMQANNDLTNLFASIDLTLVIVGKDMTIRRFTPQAEKVIGLIPSDVGRPFLNINPNIEIPELQQMLNSVISTLHPAEREVADESGVRYRMRIVPYRTGEGSHEGAVITLLELPLK